MIYGVSKMDIVLTRENFFKLLAQSSIRVCGISKPHANVQQCFVYKYQGQYSYQISYQGVSPYGFQTAGNMLAFVSGLIAAALYGNIGIV